MAWPSPARALLGGGDDKRAPAVSHSGWRLAGLAGLAGPYVCWDTAREERAGGQLAAAGCDAKLGRSQELLCWALERLTG
jgi:hypothetical protein